MPYAITQNSWRGVEPGWPIDHGETLVEEIPAWLIEKVALDDQNRDSMAALRLLIEQANTVISPLQAGVDLDEITEEDRALWKAWKRYLIALSKTPEREGWPFAPDWPALPQSQ